MQKTAFDSGQALAFLNCPPGRYRGLTKTLLVMKLTILFTAIAFFQVHASGLAQTVTISGKDLTLKQVFAAIDKQTGYALMTNKGTLDASKPVTLTVHKMPLKEFLDFVLKEELEYEIEGKTIFVSRKKKIADASAGPPQDSNDPSLLMIGMIKNTEGEVLSGVSVRIKNTNNGTITDNKGFFRLQTEKENPALLISMIGYQTDEVVIVKAGNGYKVSSSGKALVYVDQSVRTGALSLSIVMKKSVDVMDETVVTAYGSTTRRLSTGNISTVKGEDIRRQPVLTVQEALIGRVPGLTIERTSGNSAAPVKVRIRGTNTINANAVADPLYVIDGIPLNQMNSGLYSNVPVSTGAVQAGVVNTAGENPLLFLNPADIERVDVLKDADATAIYGSRGANGVILITTRRPKGGPTSVGVSISKDIKFNQRYPRLLNTEEYLAVRKEAFMNDGIAINSNNARDLTIWDKRKYTDWQRMFVGTGGGTTVNVDVNGGAGQTNYKLSGGYATVTDLMNNGGKNERFSFMSTVTHKSKDSKFNFSLSNNVSQTDVEAYPLGSLGRLAPNAPDIYDEKMEFNFVPYRFRGGTDFPFAGLKQPSFSNSFSLMTNLQLNYELVKGLTLSTQVSYSFSNNENVNYKPAVAMDPFFGAVAFAIYGTSRSKKITVIPAVSYRTSLGKGNLSLQLVGNYEGATAGGETITAAGFANDEMMKSHNNANPFTKQVIQSFQQNRYVALAAILNYNWADKYIISLNGNRDGSSRFGPGRQFGNFGSAGATWIASEEEWMKKLLPSWFSLIKFSSSIGVTGSQNIGDYEYLSRWSSASMLNGQSTLPKYNGLNVFHPVRALNQDYQWESTLKYDFATTLGFFGNRLDMQISTYRNIAGNQLARTPTPLYTGFNEVLRNWEARLANFGIDLSLSGKVIDGKDFGLSATFNITRNRNRLLDFPDLESSSYKDNLRIGYSTNIRYLLRYTGINPATGNYSFEDVNKDGKITMGTGLIPNQHNDDRVVFLDLNNKYDGNLSLQFRYKSLSCYTNFYFINRNRMNPYLLSVVGGPQNVVLPKEIADNHWQYPGHQAKYPRYTTNASSLGPIRDSDGGYVNGSYLRMQNLSLSYSFPVKWTRKIGAKEISFSVSTQNLFTISTYKGLDPELNASTEVVPIARTIRSGLRINF